MKRIVKIVIGGVTRIVRLPGVSTAPEPAGGYTGSTYGGTYQ